MKAAPYVTGSGVNELLRTPRPSNDGADNGIPTSIPGLAYRGHDHAWHAGLDASFTVLGCAHKNSIHMSMILALH